MTENEQFAQLAKQKLSEVVDWLNTPDNKVPLTDEGMSDLGARLLGAVLVAHKQTMKPTHPPKRLIVQARLL